MHKKQRFASTSSEDRQKILFDSKAKSTQKATQSKLRCFELYLKEKGLGDEPSITDAELPGILTNFYTDLRKTDGDLYKISSLKSLCAGLNRHFKQTRGIDIVQDKEFLKPNKLFDAVKVDTKKKGKGVTVSKKAIRNDDMRVVAEYFSYNQRLKPDPRCLQENLIFNIIYYFCHWGRENLYSMTMTYLLSTLMKMARNLCTRMSMNWTKIIMRMTQMQQMKEGCTANLVNNLPFCKNTSETCVANVNKEQLICCHAQF